MVSVDGDLEIVDAVEDATLETLTVNFGEEAVDGVWIRASYILISAALELGAMPR